MYLPPSLLLDFPGTFVLNLVCRDSQLRSEVINELIRDSFQNIISYKIPEEVNEILYCSASKEQNPKQQKNKSKIDVQHPMIQSFRLVNNQIKKIRSQSQGGNHDQVNVTDDFVDLDTIMKSLRVV